MPRTRFVADPLHLMFAALGGLVLLFIVAPLASMVIHTPVADLARTAADDEMRRSVWLTLWSALLATLLLSVFSIPFAYLLARKPFPGKRLVLAIVDLPIVIPHSAAGVALLGVLSRDSLIGGTAERIGIQFVGGAPGIVAAMAFVSVPFLVNAARDGFAAVPERYEKAARSLGASSLRVFMTIAIPLAWRSILSGLVLMWARGMSEFGAVVMVAYHPMITPVFIYERFGAWGLRYARPASVLFLGVCLLVFIAARLLARGRAHAER